MVSSERSSSDLPEYTLFQIENIFFYLKKSNLIEFFFFVFFEILPRIRDYIYQTTTILYLKKNVKLIKNRYIHGKNEKFR